MSLCESCPKALQYKSLKRKPDGTHYKVPLKVYFCTVENRDKNRPIKRCNNYPVKNTITQFLESQQTTEAKP